MYLMGGTVGEATTFLRGDPAGARTGEVVLALGAGFFFFLEPRPVLPADPPAEPPASLLFSTARFTIRTEKPCKPKVSTCHMQNKENYKLFSFISIRLILVT